MADLKDPGIDGIVSELVASTAFDADAGFEAAFGAIVSVTELTKLPFLTVRLMSQ